MRRFSIVTACSVALLLASASALPASDTTFVHQGARVKVFPLGAKPVAGEVAKLAYDTMVILPEEGAEAVTFLRQDVRSIEMLQRKSNWAIGGLIGGIAGTVLGFYPVAVHILMDCNGGCDGRVAAAWTATAIGGFAIGAGIGALVRSERWVVAKMPAPPPVAISVGKDGSLRLAFSLRL